MKNLVILISGSGSNMQAIVQAAQRDDWPGCLHARIAAVVSNRPDCAGLDKARALGIATESLDHRAFANAPEPRAAFDAALADLLDRHAPDLIVLAGFMRILTPGFVRRYAGRMVNIHPSLLPAFPGLHTHRRAIEAGCRVAGVTVHRVTEELDHGPILDQAVVPVLPGDDETRLAARVLAQEHLLYPRAIERLLREQLPP
ncbi:phosphoribosylglycinamide formyltransferase [Pseudorhodoferax sp. Leaf267]|uniref:phosphoribosylglycinamide formyltransferase n=1 Tax=Pseudorhodoferax sp. Leaf267 TaxID=1736316 RepID=UPI0006F82F51|nr:phosphoribosylglycinamide formyltransferase [Pseudorhodoferax sp. Leaf267]KQP17991.1 phosphoribosylglycinamide formyltransferase [Pseudorhodoferax sp. Leaf267]